MKKKINKVIKQKVDVKTVALVTLGILLIPLIAMQLTSEVNWSFFDFAAVGILIFGTGVTLDFMAKKVKDPVYKVAAIAAVIIAFLLIWVELAVGIFGTPFAGN